MVSFPIFFENAMVIGSNHDGEALAVGMYHGVPWLSRLDTKHNQWITVRPADQEELDRYDFLYLHEMSISIGDDDDTRTHYCRN